MIPKKTSEDLANETLLNIIRRLQGSELKSLRLTSKRYSVLADQFLFEHIVIIPHQRLLRNLADFLESSPLVHHTNEITYDDRWSDIVEYLLQEKHRQLRDEVSLYKEGHEAILETKSCLFRYVATMPEESQLLRSVFAWLRHMCRIGVREGYFDRSSKDESHPIAIARLLSQARIGDIGEGVPRRSWISHDISNISELEATHWERRSATGLVLMALDELNDRSLSLVANLNRMNRPMFHICTRSGFQQNYATLQLSMLRNIDVSVKKDEIRGRGSIPLVGVLKLAGNLTGLCLTLYGGYHGNGPNDRAQPDLEEAAESLIKRLVQESAALPPLKTLSLNGFTCVNEHISLLLARLAGSLTALELRNMCVVHEQNGQAKPCFVKMLSEVRALSLAHFQISGKFWDGGRQKLDFGDQRKSYRQKYDALPGPFFPPVLLLLSPMFYPRETTRWRSECPLTLQIGFSATTMMRLAQFNTWLYENLRTILKFHLRRSNWSEMKGGCGMFCMYQSHT